MPPRRRPASRAEGPARDTRSRILAAARDLAVEKGFDEFTVEKVAEQAGVSRMTVYYQFGSKQELLEALFDQLAERGGMDRLAEEMKREDPLDSLAGLVAVFCGFWASDRVALRRLRSWGGLRPAAAAADADAIERDAWRRRALETVARRIAQRYGKPARRDVKNAVDLLQVLTSFESYDVLARGGRDESDIAELLSQAALTILGVTEARGH
ncbi:MAG TPA: helix-turn-helix domain-containing protein [Gemmatimonadaceae bacterium]